MVDNGIMLMYMFLFDLHNSNICFICRVSAGNYCLPATEHVLYICLVLHKQTSRQLGMSINHRMKRTVTEKSTVDNKDFTKEPLPKGEYEYCVFSGCDFSNSDLSEVFFSDCEFSACNLSMVNLAKATLRDITFRDCKMLGIRFDNVNQFGLGIAVENCTLNHSSFYQAKLKKTVFRNTSLQEVDFAAAELADAVFDNCDLAFATFDNTNLERADFRTAVNYSIDPELNRVKKAKFSLPGIAGLLSKYDIDIEHDI